MSRTDLCRGSWSTGSPALVNAARVAAGARKASGTRAERSLRPCLIASAQSVKALAPVLGTHGSPKVLRRSCIAAAPTRTLRPPFPRAELRRLPPHRDTIHRRRHVRVGRVAPVTIEVRVVARRRERPLCIIARKITHADGGETASGRDCLRRRRECELNIVGPVDCLCRRVRCGAFRGRYV